MTTSDPFAAGSLVWPLTVLTIALTAMAVFLVAAIFFILHALFLR